MIRDFNPQLWFGKRQVDTLPPHFVKAHTALTTESLEWVKSKLTGRYTVLENTSMSITSLTMLDLHSYIYFEDPKEAMYYELRWSGGKNN